MTMAPLRALVADDDPEMLEMVSSAVAREFGAQVTCVASGGELLERIAEDAPFDFIVTDISMPWMTGLQVMHSARTAGLPVPVLVMTALREPGIADQVQALGEHARLLRKPFSFEQLTGALHEVLHGAKRATELRSVRARRD
jgi:CheY-like chemotaxis protein